MEGEKTSAMTWPTKWMVMPFGEAGDSSRGSGLGRGNESLRYAEVSLRSGAVQWELAR